MHITIHPSSIGGEIRSPRSKSSMQRACAAALLHRGVSEILQPGTSNDDLAAIDVIRKLGARIEEQPGLLRVHSGGVDPLSDTVHCGESGLGIRMFTPIAALSDRRLTITGTGSLVSRPMDFFDRILPSLGVETASNGGRLPLVVKGPLRPADITVDGSLSSQFLTGLLMAFSAAGARGVTIRTIGLKSKPYIELTLSVMRSFGMSVPRVRDMEYFHFPADVVAETPAPVLRYTVEGDWSGAAFLIVAGATAGDIVIDGLQADSVQADRAVLQALRLAGGNHTFDEGRLRVHRSELSAFRFDATECPDLFPPLVALASAAEGVTLLTGVSRLAHKESDRGRTLQEEFGKMGVHIELHGDVMHVHGGGPCRQAATHSRHDHRIAMACAVAALRAEGPVTIEAAEAVGKSYPDFYRDLHRLGARIQDLAETGGTFPQH